MSEKETVVQFSWPPKYPLSDGRRPECMAKGKPCHDHCLCPLVRP